jgi:tetrathionate reductase subunit A
VVPDSVLYESWGFGTPWHGVPTRVSTARWPVVEPAMAKTASGEPIGMEAFFIACAKSMGLPGFGESAIKDGAGASFPLNRAEDYYLRAGANVAFGGQKPVNDASDDDIALSGLDRLNTLLQATLKPEEWRKVAHVLARGGRFQPVNQAYQGEQMATKYPRPLQLYNEVVATSRSAITGKRHAGTPKWIEPSFADGTPLRKRHSAAEWPMLLTSQKSVLVNSYTIGVDRLRSIHVDNPVSLHAEDAKALGVKNGERIRITTPGGSVVGTALVRHGIMRGVVSVEHGYGHKELGARVHVIGGVRQPLRPELAAGINLNDLGLPDPSAGGQGIWLDPVAGSAVRQGLPARIERVG